MNIPIHEKWAEFCTDLGVTVRASRPFVRIELINGDGATFRANAILDTGAPFSVIPFSIWHDREIPWQILGSRLSRQDKQDTAALVWLGVDCRLGETPLILSDKPGGIRSRPMRVIAKFPLSKVSSHLEKEVILGYNFFRENRLEWILKDSLDGGVGTIIVPN